MAKKKDDKSSDVGRPSGFKPEYVDLVYKLCLLGATDVEMADILDVAESTFHKWKLDFPEFSESIKRGKKIADAEIASSLFNRARGFSHPDVHVSSYEGDITLTPITKHYPPDTQAASLWLRNRQPEKWRDKQEHELTGKDGAPLVPTINLTLGTQSKPPSKAD